MLKIIRFLIVSMMGLPLLGYAQETKWTNLSDGIQYTVLYPENPSSGLHAFRIDLKKYHLQLKVAKNVQQTALFVDQLSDDKRVLIGINGGFFSPTLQPLGLRVSEGQAINPIKKISWWGVFLVRNHQASIIPQSAYNSNMKSEFAIQAGPRLIANGVLTKLHAGEAQRSALGITRDGKVIIAVTDNYPLSTESLAKIMSRSEKNGGLACVSALNLDGGTSSQLYAQINHFSLHIRSIRPVADLIFVTPR